MACHRPFERRLLHVEADDDAPDRVIVNNLELRVRLKGDKWHRDEPIDQPVRLTIVAHADTSKAGYSDDLRDSFSYVQLAVGARSLIEDRDPPFKFRSLYQLARSLAGDALSKTAWSSRKPPVVSVEVVQPNGFLHAKSLAVTLHRRRVIRGDASRDDAVVYSINGMCLDVIIGVREYERAQAQPIVVTIRMHADGSLNLPEVAKAARAYIANTRFELIESLCHRTSLFLLHHFQIEDVEMRAGKPAAAVWTESMDVQTFRSRVSPLSNAKASLAADASLRESLRARGKEKHVAVIALGSNLGDRADFLWRALDAVRADPQTTVLDTSFLYESSPFIVLDQPPFLNACFAVRSFSWLLMIHLAVEQVSTDRSAAQLLDLCKKIEQSLGRVKTIEKGPRCVDLDILLYDDERITDETDHGPLVVPHSGIQLRKFVLQPLMDLIPEYQMPRLEKTVRQVLGTFSKKQRKQNDDDSRLSQVFPLRASHGLESPYIVANGPTQIMSIINVTPDSFSDGGEAFLLEDALMAAHRHQEEGAHLLDIGGASTRPGAQDPGALEESRRVVPVIESLRRQGSIIPISVDTYRADVAQKAIEAGANVINDVSCGAYPESEGLLEKAAKLRCPLILMHSRGTPETMLQLLDYGEEGVIAGARRELSARVEQAMLLGIPRWAIMVDPGIGFAKDTQKNLEILRGLDGFCTEELEGFPMLFGASRKRFLGALTGHEAPSERNWATSATVAAAIQAGAQVVRVHDTKEMRDVAKVADAIWKSPSTVH